MKLLIRRADGSWAEPEITGHKSEDDLQELLATSPDLLPGSETGLPMAVARELRVATGQIDVVGVDVEGELTLCECKLAANPGARREVVGQLLEYAGALRGMTFEDLSSRFEARAGRPMAASVSHIAGEGFDEESFEGQVAENLRAGRFRLVIVVDRITEALKQTVTYLNDHLDSSILALELAYLRDGEVEMLVPAVYGEEVAERKERDRNPPVADADTVVVAARIAYQEYLETGSYVCQAGRRFRDDIEYLGFYKDKAIQPEVPVIRHRRDSVTFSRDKASSLRASGDESDAIIAGLIDENLDSGRRAEGDSHQVFLLSSPGDEMTLVLPQEIPHAKKGAWTQGQRYTSSEALRRGAATTEELQAEGG
ncbi:MAG: hypothetical protein ACRDOS_05990 [Gaiellaceae bacterium]